MTLKKSLTTLKSCWKKNLSCKLFYNFNGKRKKKLPFKKNYDFNEKKKNHNTIYDFQFRKCKIT